MPVFFADCRCCSASSRSEVDMKDANRLARIHEASCRKRRCGHCRKVLPSEMALNIHMKYMHKALGCPECFELFPTVDDFTKHLREKHETAGKVMVLNRDESLWSASTLAGEIAFQIDHKDIVQADSGDAITVGNLKDGIADAMKQSRHTIALLGDGQTLTDDTLLSNFTSVVMKLDILVERTHKKQALQEKIAGNATQG